MFERLLKSWSGGNLLGRNQANIGLVKINHKSGRGRGMCSRRGVSWNWSATSAGKIAYVWHGRWVTRMCERWMYKNNNEMVPSWTPHGSPHVQSHGCLCFGRSHALPKYHEMDPKWQKADRSNRYFRSTPSTETIYWFSGYYQEQNQGLCLSPHWLLGVLGDESGSWYTAAMGAAPVTQWCCGSAVRRVLMVTTITWPLWEIHNALMGIQCRYRTG